MDAALTVTGALLAGCATSFHCVGMCGPIICGLGTLSRSEEERLIATTCYHGCRLLSYSLFGALCGTIGHQPLRWFFDSPAVILPWVMVVALLMLAFGLEKKIPHPLVLSKWIARVKFRIGHANRTSKFGAIGSSSMMGLLTPFLPCGPLYLLFGVTLLSGSPLKGAELALAFGLGTVPLLWLAQHTFHKWRARLTPMTMMRLQRSLAFLTAIVMAWRLHDTLPTFSQTSDPHQDIQEMPSCCHE